MDTLIIKNGTNPRWYPQAIMTYKAGIKIPYGTPENRRLNSNFAYSLQYIEYLEKQLAELSLSEVVRKMVYYSYIVGQHENNARNRTWQHLNLKHMLIHALWQLNKLDRVYYTNARTASKAIEKHYLL